MNNRHNYFISAKCTNVKSHNIKQIKCDLFATEKDKSFIFMLSTVHFAQNNENFFPFVLNKITMIDSEGKNHDLFVKQHSQGIFIIMISFVLIDHHHPDFPF
jgi:hypothetical protein